ncbi:hypothetical protein [Streptomyces sp. NPDC006510]
MMPPLRLIVRQLPKAAVDFARFSSPSSTPLMLVLTRRERPFA